MNASLTRLGPRAQTAVSFTVFASLAIGSLVLSALTSSSASKPETATTTNAAVEMLEKIDKAYANLESAKMTGEIQVEVVVAGEKQKTNQHFTSAFQAPNRFRHESTDGILTGCDGHVVYVFNRTANTYVLMDSAEGRVKINVLPPIVPQLLQSQNPALLFAISEAPLKEVRESFDKISIGKPVQIDRAAFSSLELTSSERAGKVTMLVDPKTSLLRRFIIDFSSSLEEDGTNIDSAVVTVDYKIVDAKATLPESHFAWTPPKDALDAHEAAGAAREKEAEEEPEMLPRGANAPDFTLNTLEGKPVSLSNLKGRVVVLDFWATWCPPCVQSLPMLSELRNDLNSKEVVVYAVNMDEDLDKVRTFLDLKNIRVPVLMDEKGRIAKKYEVHSIPQTVVIGKDGLVKKVLHGYGEETEEQLREAIRFAQTEGKR